MNLCKLSLLLFCNLILLLIFSSSILKEHFQKTTHFYLIIFPDDFPIINLLFVGHFLIETSWQFILIAYYITYYNKIFDQVQHIINVIFVLKLII